MALVKTIRNFVDQLIFDYPAHHNSTKPKYIICDIDNFIRFRDELRASNLLTPEQLDISKYSGVIEYQGLKILPVLDIPVLIEVVG